MTVTFQDIDGDDVTVKVSKPIFTTDTINQVFTFANGRVDGDNSMKQQLQVIDFFKLTDPTAAAGSFLKINAVPSPTNGGDDRVNLGTIRARHILFPYQLGIDLDIVKVDGDVAEIDAGDADPATAAIRALRVYSMGAYGTANQPQFRGTLFSDLRGSLGSLRITTDMKAKLTVNFGNIGSVWIGGSLIGADHLTGSIGTNGFPGRIGPVVVRGDVRGESGAFSGEIHAIEIERVTIGGSLTGNETLSGTVTAFHRLGPVRIAGSTPRYEANNGPRANKVTASWTCRAGWSAPTTLVQRQPLFRFLAPWRRRETFELVAAGKSLYHQPGLFASRRIWLCATMTLPRTRQSREASCLLWSTPHAQKMRRSVHGAFCLLGFSRRGFSG